ncbi:hypothetical protein AWL63_13445 [Sphingomonas panacis]|uniref:Tetratrico peptide repeat group 5 domain-containing protein n=1 Tax=Sphingomonas panacis TaxID=1560345 RepID=A0A1B3ZBL5_9SPHN|nr:hypothetical protein [Sphingomonas panacis]AOH84817.1 hypothetical protein AWL63_13445 [Sphingomonas panacis]
MNATSNEQWMGDPALEGVLHYAKVVADAGRPQDAVTLLEQRYATFTKDPAQAASRIFLLAREAIIRFDAGEREAAIDLLERAAQDASLEGEYKLNIDVNQAMLQARAGQYQAAFVVINDAWRRFDAQNADAEESFKVPSSEANFAWIKACALDGLGQHEKARSLMAQIDAGTPRSPDRAVEAQARINGFVCMHDDASLADEFVAQLATAIPLSDVFVLMQPESHFDARERATVAAALRRPVVAESLAVRARLLAPAFQPALENWASTAPRPH